MSDVPNPDDLFWFLRIADLLERGCTLSEIATRLKKSLSFISETLDRVQSRMRNQPLLAKGSGSGGKYELSELGRNLLKGVYDQFREIATKAERLQVAISFSLVTCGLINPAIREFLNASSREEVEFSLELKSTLAFGALVQDLQAGRLDLAVIWSEPERMKEIGDLKAEKFDETPFDLVVVATDESLIRRVNQALVNSQPEASGGRFAAAKMERLLREVTHGRKHVRLAVGQPLAGAFCSQSELRENLAIKTDSFDASIAILKAKAADFAITPAFYSTFERARGRGELFYSNPVGQLPVAVLYAPERPPSSYAKQLIRLMKAQLVVATRRIFELAEWTALPELAQMKNLRYGYYIDGNREMMNQRPSGTSQSQPPFRWKWEMFEWESIRGKSPERISGEIRNVDGGRFNCSATKASSAIIIEANVPNDGAPNIKSTQKFVSFFTKALNDPLRLVGVWTTTEHQSFEAYAMVMSEKRLRIEELERIQHASYRAVLSAEQGVRFENQL